MYQHQTSKFISDLDTPTGPTLDPNRPHSLGPLLPFLLGCWYESKCLGKCCTWPSKATLHFTPLSLSLSLLYILLSLSLFLPLLSPFSVPLSTSALSSSSLSLSFSLLSCCLSLSRSLYVCSLSCSLNVSLSLFVISHTLINQPATTTTTIIITIQHRNSIKHSSSFATNNNFLTTYVCVCSLTVSVSVCVSEYLVYPAPYIVQYTHTHTRKSKDPLEEKWRQREMPRTYFRAGRGRYKGVYHTYI